MADSEVIDPRFLVLMGKAPPDPTLTVPEAPPAAAPTGDPTAALPTPPASGAAIDPAYQRLMESAPRAPAIPTEEPSIFRPIDMMTGRDRTEFPDRREINPGDVARANGNNPITATAPDPQYQQVLAGFLTAPNVQAKIDILRSATGLPQSAFTQDRHGNWMVNYNGETMYLNKPGMSDTEVLQGSRDAAVGAIALFNKMPGWLGLAARGITAGALAGASSLGFDRAAQLTGSNEPVDVGKAVQTGLFSGVTAAAAPGVANLVSRGVQRLRGGRATVAPRDNLMTEPSPQFTPEANARAGTLSIDGEMTLEAAGIDHTMYTPGQIAEIVDLARKSGPTPGPDAFREAAARVRGAEMGIPRTTGQTTRDPAQLAREATLRNDGNASVAGLDRQQGEAATAALEAARNRLGQGSLPMEMQVHPSDAGTMVAERLVARQEAAATRVSNAYDRVEALEPASLQFTRDRTVDFRNRLTGAAADQFDILGSATEAALKQVRAIAGNGRGNPPVINLSQVEQLRRQLGAAIRGGAPDSPALIRMSQGLDGWVDEAIEAGSYSGRGETVEALKAARTAAREQAADFHPDHVPPRVTTILKRITEQGVTGQEVMDGLLDKAADLGGANSLAAIRHIERLTGRTVDGAVVPDPMVRTMIQQTAMQRLFEGVEANTPATMKAAADRIDAATTGRGRQVIEHLFDEEQRNSLRRLSTELRDISQLSASEAGKKLAQETPFILGTLGGTLGGAAAHMLGLEPTIGATAGGMVGLGARVTANRLAGRAAVNPPAPVTDWRTLIPSQQAAPAAAQGLFRQLGDPAARMLFSPEPERTGLFQ